MAKEPYEDAYHLVDETVDNCRPTHSTVTEQDLRDKMAAIQVIISELKKIPHEENPEMQAEAKESVARARKDIDETMTEVLRLDKEGWYPEAMRKRDTLLEGFKGAERFYVYGLLRVIKFHREKEAVKIEIDAASSGGK